jgi:DNA-binding XRE family transcriptional regulator
MGIKNERVFSLMRELGFKKSDMADALGISRSAVTQWEKKGTEPTLQQCVELSKLFRVSIEEIIDPEELKGLQTDIRKYMQTTSQADVHYTDPLAADLAQEMADRPGMRTLFAASRNLSEDDLQIVNQLVQKLTNK